MMIVVEAATAVVAVAAAMVRRYHLTFVYCIAFKSLHIGCITNVTSNNHL